MRYQRQITGYHCVPASLSMIIHHKYGERFHQKYLGTLMKTDKSGTYDPDLRKGLGELGFRLKQISRKKADNFLKKGHEPIALTYRDSPESQHMAVALSSEKLSHFKANLVTLNDPYYGHNYRIADCTLENLAVRYFRVLRAK